jgi:ATP-binding cassette subfamily B multidrug efflux pump
MFFLLRYVKKYGGLFCLALICLAAEALGDLLQPTIMSRIIDQGVAHGDLRYVMFMGGLMLLITAFGALVASGRNVISSNVSQRFGTELRFDLYRRIMDFSFHAIGKFENASLVTRLTNDITQVQNFINGMMRIFVKAPILCVGGIIMAVILNPGMSLVLAVVVPVVGALIVLNLRFGYRRFRRVQTAIDMVNGVMREYLSGVRVVKSFNRFTYETGRFERSNNELVASTSSAMRVMAAFTPAITLTVNLGIVSVLWFGGYRVSGNAMKIGQIIAFVNYMTQILQSLMIISNVFNIFVRARASSERISEVLLFEDNDSGKISIGTGTPINDSFVSPDIQGMTVEFEHVSFSYSGGSEKRVLTDVSLVCRKGHILGIIGATGSGKTSLISLVPRFHEVTSGRVLVDGTDVRSYDVHALRQRFGLVPQSSVLFMGTIIENIRWGMPDASEDEVREAARLAAAHEFIAAFPEGYETRLGQGGVNLSGGQKQRVSIARALVRRPDILVLDDATSSVDFTTEATIRENLRKNLAGTTIMLIAQRITSVMAADTIAVLDDGALAGSGTHEELIRTCGVYRDIYRSQMGSEALTND